VDLALIGGGGGNRIRVRRLEPDDNAPVSPVIAWIPRSSLPVSDPIFCEFSICKSSVEKTAGTNEKIAMK
jgi:hypothetical protein